MKTLKKLLTGVVMVLAAFGLGIGIHASEISVYTDGIPYEGEVRLVNGRAYVSLREFACTVDEAEVFWNEETMTATVETDSLRLTAKRGGNYLTANGRYLWCAEGIFTDAGVLYVPLQRVAQAFGYDSDWSSEDNANYLTRKGGQIEGADTYYDKDDVYWLSRIIHAEAQGEPFSGKLAVGSVVLNRTEDEQFPDEVYDVIFDNKSGVQFTPTVNGTINAVPGEESVIAAKLCLEGFRTSADILYFLNPDIATSLWVTENRTFVVSIGGHDFYA